MAAPYSYSTEITGINWDHSGVVTDADGSDLFPCTMDSIGDILTAWGDGWGFEDTCEHTTANKVSMGISVISGTPTSFSVADVCGKATCGADNNHCYANYPEDNNGKFCDIVYIDGTVYAWVNEQVSPNTYAMYKSTDDGETWTRINATEYDADTNDLHPRRICHFGQNANYDSSNYVYFIGYVEGNKTNVYLWRVAKGNIENKANYEVFSGTAESPAWSGTESNRTSIFYDADQTRLSSISYNSDLGRFIYTGYHGDNLAKLGVFESNNIYGPWATIEYNESWGGLSTTFGHIVPINEWTTDNGLTMWWIYSGDGTYDRFNLIKGELSTGTGAMAENYNIYTEVDPNSKISIDSATQISFVSLNRGETAYVYKDAGVNHFDGNFEHQFDFQITDDNNNAFVVVWALANELNDYYTIEDVSLGDCLCVAIFDGDTDPHELQIRECDGGTRYTDSYQISQNTRYYLTVERDESVGTYGTLYCYVYSDSARTNLLDTLSLTLHTSLKDYRYVYALMSGNTSNTEYARSGDVQNLDLQEGVTIACGFGQITATGLQSTISTGEAIECNAGQIAVTALTAGISAGVTIECNPGQLGIASLQAGISTGTTINCSLGTISITGLQAEISAATTIECSVGQVSITGLQAEISNGIIIDCTLGQLVIAGLQAGISTGTTINCGYGQLSIVGLQAGISAGKTIDCSAGQISIESYAAQVAQEVIIECSTGAVIIAGLPAEMSVGKTINCQSAAVEIGGYQASLVTTETAVGIITISVSASKPTIIIS